MRKSILLIHLMDIDGLLHFFASIMVRSIVTITFAKHFAISEYNQKQNISSTIDQEKYVICSPI